MKILVDTCIWSLALRRIKQPRSNIEVIEFQKLIELDSPKFCEIPEP